MIIGIMLGAVGCLVLIFIARAVDAYVDRLGAFTVIISANGTWHGESNLDRSRPLRLDGSNDAPVAGQKQR